MKSLYIHIPFCKSICSYCDFAKMFYNENLALSYLDELSNEVNNNYKQDMLETIYIGGGTPSILNKKELNKLFSITNKLNIEPNYEFTIEANIADINEEFLSLCKSNKVNRLSIGIETINDKFYKFLNRENNIEDIKNKIILAKKYFSNINIDLMYAFPNETMEDLKCDLDFFKSLDVEHISIYSLIIEENTKLYIDGIKPISEELDREMYYYIIDYLENIGYKHYEISNFSKEGLESRHNLNYWNNLNYYGFGLGASGYIENTRYTNTRGINSYLKGNYKIYEEKLDKNKMMEEELICGLRKMKGINEKTFEEKFGIDIRDVFNIDDLINKGLLIEEDNYIYIPKDKLYVSNNILLNFILD